MGTTIAEIRTSGAAVASEVGHRGDDVRLLTGRGRFVADELPRRALHMAIVRSPLAHAEIARVDVEPALAVPGVRAAYSGAELATALRPFPGVVKTAPPYLPVAVERARYAGEPVAVVLADSRYEAEDGCGLVQVDYDELDAVVDPQAAMDPAAPRLHPEHEGGNLAWSRRYVYGSPEEAFAAADRVVGVETTFPRYNSTPLEPYGVVADWDRAAGELTVRANFQGPFSLHPVLCAALGLDLNQVRLIVPDDIGGSFGVKAMIYPYIALAAVASRFAGSPVVWLEDRQEHFYGSASGTNRLTHVEAAVTADGVVLGLRYRILEDVGAYLRAPEPSCVMRSLTMFAGPYRVPHGDVAVDVVMTNKLPTGLNRGYGGQQHIFTLERVIDAVARDLGLEPDEVRRRNLIDAREFPFETASGTRYDSGDYGAALALVLERSGYRERRRRSRDLGDRWVGVGLATAVHSSAANMGYVTLALEPDARAQDGYRPKSGARETATLRVDLAGKVTVEIASAGCGQGHRRTMAGLVASILELPPGDVRAIDRLDTATTPWSVSSGSFSSRFTVMVGNAVALAAETLKRQLLELAAARLRLPVADLHWREGCALDPASARSVSLKELAGATHWDAGSLATDTPPLAATRTFSATGMSPPDRQDRVNAALTYGFMADVAVVEIDKRTLLPRLVAYYAVHDLGRTLEPEVVRGQVAGGVLHGMGGALFEELAYDALGQPRAVSFVDYLSPTAAEAPRLELEHLDVPSPSNPLGVKGGGESSAMSAPAAIAAAVEDALGHADIRVDRLPVDPAALWAALARPS